MRREWLMRSGRLRIAVIMGLFFGLLFGIGMGVFSYWAGSRSAVGAIAVGVVAGAAFGTLMVVRPWPVSIQGASARGRDATRRRRCLNLDLRLNKIGSCVR
jgi:hypothetical protein